MTAITILQDYWSYILFGAYPKGPLGGIALTLLLATTSLAVALPWALGVALARSHGPSWLARAGAVYVTVARGVPLLVWIFWIYFLVPALTGHAADPFLTLIGAIVLYQGAYLSEVLRAGLLALPKGQMEAALALGLTRRLALRKVILPQIVVQVLPGVLSQMTLIVKESALGYVIALGEATFVMGQINLDLMTKPLSVFALLAGIYYLICAGLSGLANSLSRAAPWTRIGAGGSAMRRQSQ